MTAADLSVIVQPTINTYYPDYNQISTFSTIAANTINAFKNENGHMQTLFLGGSSNVHVEAVQDVNLFMTQGDFQLFRSTHDGIHTGDAGRTDYQMLGITMDATTSNAYIYSPMNAIELQAGDVDNTYILGGFRISDSNNYTVFQTVQPNGFMFKSAFNVERLLANSDMVVASNLYVNGHVMSKDLNVFKDLTPALENDLMRVGYAFRINEKHQLELIKYSRFYNDLPDAQKKVAVFGMQDLKFTDSNDFPGYVAFGDLLNVSWTNGKTGTRVYGTEQSPWVNNSIDVNLWDAPNGIVELDPGTNNAYLVNLNPTRDVLNQSVVGIKGTITFIERSPDAHEILYNPTFTFAVGKNQGVMSTPAPDAWGGYAVDELIYIVLTPTMISASYRNVLIVPGTKPIPTYQFWKGSQVMGFPNNIIQRNDIDNGVIVADTINTFNELENVTLTDGTTQLTGWTTAAWVFHAADGTIDKLITYYNETDASITHPNPSRPFVASLQNGFVTSFDQQSYQQVGINRKLYDKNGNEVYTLPNTVGGSFLLRFMTSPAISVAWGWDFGVAPSFNICTDKNENVIWCGMNWSGLNTLDIAPIGITTNPVSVPLVNGNNSQYILAKFSSAGAFQWYAYTTNYRGYGTVSIASDSTGAVYMAHECDGSFQTIVDSTSTTTTVAPYTSTIPGSGLLIKFNASGVLQWTAKCMAGMVVDVVCNDTDNLFVSYISGKNTLVFDSANVLVKTLASPTFNNIAITKWTPNGTFEWAAIVENCKSSNGVPWTNNTVTTWDGGCVVSGSFHSSIAPVIYNADGTLYQTVDIGSYQAGGLVVKYNGMGQAEWFVLIGTTSQYSSNALSLLETADRGIIIAGRPQNYQYVAQPYPVIPLTAHDASNATHSLADTYFIKVNKNGLFGIV